MRLARFLAHSGVASRRVAEELIREGRVTVAGSVVTDPARDVDVDSDVRFDGRSLEPEEREVWIVNKPLDVVSTAREPGNRRAVTELVSSPFRLYPVGRLDADSTGLILLTNDGDLANRLSHPRYEVPKTYRVDLASPLSSESIALLRKGVSLEDGLTSPAEVEPVGKRSALITIHEGRNRQVRRMAEAVGNRVEALTRVSFGPLELAGLEEGAARKLSPLELERLWEYALKMGDEH